MEYKTIFIDSQNSKKGTLAPIINGDNMAREMQAALNQMHTEGFTFFNSIEVNSSVNTMMEGVILIFRRSMPID